MTTREILTNFATTNRARLFRQPRAQRADPPNQTGEAEDHKIRAETRRHAAKDEQHDEARDEPGEHHESGEKARAHGFKRQVGREA